MTTVTYDDGSTLSYDAMGVSSTPAPAGMMLSDYGSNFTPQAMNSGARDWLDVLKYGIGRVADYATVVHAPQNTPAYHARQPVGAALPHQYGSAMGGLNMSVLLWAGLAFFLVKSLSGGKKG